MLQRLLILLVAAQIFGGLIIRNGLSKVLEPETGKFISEGLESAAIFGVAGVMGLLAGGLTSGFAMAIFMANAGGAWDNAKKYIEKGNFGGKGSEAHKASIVGDTVGDPFKDTSGPSLNILIKLMSMVSVVFAGLIVKFAPPIGDFIGL